MAIKPMDEYFNSILKENKRKKYKSVELLVSMLDSRQHPELIKYLELHSLLCVDDNIMDTLKRVNALLSI